MIEKELIVNGKRTDGRTTEELRPVEMKVGVVKRANGSATVRFGNTQAVAAVYGPRNLFPRHLQESETGIIRCRYSMAPFSVDERKSPAPDRRSTEISKITRLALEPVIFLEDFPKTTIDVFIDILQADGSTRVTGINAASLALVCAGVPMKDMITACSVGKVNGELVVDLNGEEDNNSEVDMSFAMMSSKKKITVLQMDGVLTKDELLKLIENARKNCEKIYGMQKDVIKKKYMG